MSSDKRIAVAMSGGVDSSVACARLINDGWEVTGVFFVFTDHNLNDKEDVSNVAGELGIPIHTVDLRQKFNNIVVSTFVSSYRSGITPNPCVCCNGQLKFPALAQFANDIGAQWIATGHYARIGKDVKTNRYYVQVPRDSSRDQSYFLYQLTQEILSRLVLPLGDATKNDVRRLAREYGLKVSEKPDSQDVCFLEHGRYVDFLKAHGGIGEPGPVVGTHGNVIGEHDGLAMYTIGQRHGIRLSRGKPLYVVGIDKNKNTLIVGDVSELEVSSFRVGGFERMALAEGQQEFRALVKIRSRSKTVDCMVKRTNGETCSVCLDYPEYAVTPGQSAVFYDGDKVLGGGIIAL